MLPIRDNIPSRRQPLMTWLLILVNIAVFVYEWTIPEQEFEGFLQLCGIVPARYTHAATAEQYTTSPWLPFLTSMFLHGGWLHVLSNLWTLWIFGDNVEDRMGPLKFLLFYLLSGLVASIVHIFTNAGSPIPTIGASGAIAGVMGAYLVLYPRAMVLTVVPILFYPLFLELPAVLYLGLWFVAQVFSGTAALHSETDVGGIAWFAHIGGFVAGIALLAVFLERKGRRRRKSRPF